jgi:micrococcal nuclease
LRTACLAQIVGIALLSGLMTTASVASDSCAPEAGSTHGVIRIIDGETLVLDDGQELRLVGALAPKPDALSAGANEWPPAGEAARALETLVGDRSISLRFDGRKRDRYGRVLAQAYVAARDTAGEDGGLWIQERLVRDGHARAYALPGNGGCLRALMAAEQEARAAQRGVWHRENYRVRAADDADALLRLVGRFALVEGRVVEVSRGQRTTYLNFGTDWRNDFTASLASAVLARSADGVERVTGLAGKRVRVRGWIERRNGPMIVLGSLDAIEVLDEQETKTPR